jgi:hypothetical protein
MTGRHARDYYEASVPPPGHRPATRLPALDTGCIDGGTTRGSSHVHHVIDRSGRHPALLRQHRHAYAAGIRRDLPTVGARQLRSRRHQALTSPEPSCTADRPTSTRFEHGFGLRSVNHWFAYAIPSDLARQARTVWQSRHAPPSKGAACHPPRRSPDQAAPSLHQAAATTQRGRSLTSPRPHSASRRTAPPRRNLLQLSECRSLDAAPGSPAPTP